MKTPSCPTYSKSSQLVSHLTQPERPTRPFTSGPPAHPASPLPLFQLSPLLCYYSHSFLMLLENTQCIPPCGLFHLLFPLLETFNSNGHRLIYSLLHLCSNITLPDHCTENCTASHTISTLLSSFIFLHHIFIFSYPIQLTLSSLLSVTHRHTQLKACSMKKGMCLSCSQLYIQF